jgi:hypothetical protein
VRLRWLSAEEGGRHSPPAGPRHVTAARFATPSLAVEDFSVVLDLAAGGQLASLRLLAPEQVPGVAQRILPGARVTLLEGQRVVAEAEVQYVAEDETAGD